GGVAGLIARLLGKQPPDTHVWVLTGDAPLSSNWKVRSTPAVPCGELNWQLRQDSNRSRLHRRRSSRNLLAEACWGFGYRSASSLKMNRFLSVAPLIITS